MRRIVSIGRRRDRPAPVLDTDVDLELANRAPADPSFIAGNGIASRCRYVLNYGPPTINPEGRDGWYFCRTDAARWFLEHDAPRTDFVLFTHNSDDPIGPEFRRDLGRRRLRAWFAANVELDHPKLHPVPVGVANPRWPHGDAAALARVQAARVPKSELFDASFSPATNPVERAYCVEQTGLAPGPPRPFEEYLTRLAASYFCISPRGNGIDTHRTWEALYLGAVPVVTRSILTDRHPDLPLIVLDDWAEFRSIDFSPELHARTWGGWSPQAIGLDRYLERVDRIAR